MGLWGSFANYKKGENFPSHGDIFEISDLTNSGSPVSKLQKGGFNGTFDKDFALSLMTRNESH